MGTEISHILHYNCMCFADRKKCIQVWNDMRVLFSVYYPFKIQK